MAQTDKTIQRSFASGEISDLLIARADLDRWKTSLQLCSNLVALPQGALTKRPGTQRIWQAMDNSILIPFKYSASDGYAIEATAGKFRFFRNYGAILSGSAPFELTVPFTADEIPNLYWCQTADVMYIASGVRPIQKLTRYGHTSWTIADADIRGGPFLESNADDDIYLYTTDVSPTMALGGLIKGTSVQLKVYSSDPDKTDLFSADMVGALLKIAVRDDETSGGNYGSWETGKSVNTGAVVTYNGNWYRCTAQLGKTGANPPTHTSGAQWDGLSTSTSAAGVKWLYLHSGYGVMKITAYTSASEVTAVVVSDEYVPDELCATAESEVPGDGGTNRWSEGAWSYKRGFPKIVTLHQDRLTAANTTAKPSTWWSSSFDDFEVFHSGSDDTDAFNRVVMADDEVPVVQWMLTGQVLAIGTSGPEFIGQASTSHPRMTPDNAYTLPCTNEGSAAIHPVRIDKPVFVSKDTSRILSMSLADNAVDYVCEDLSIFADHLTGAGVAGLAWQRDPYRVLWVWRTDGMLLGFTYRPDQGVKSWHRHVMTYPGVKSACIVPSDDGLRQDVWMIVERAFPGGTKRYVEVMMPYFEKGDLSVENGWFVDCGTRYEGDAATVFTVGSDFNGVLLWVLADGKFIRDVVVSGGKFTLTNAASNVLWGLPYTAELVTLPYDRSYDGGANSARKVRSAGLAVRLRNSCCVEAYASLADGTKGDVISPTGPADGGAMDAAPTLVSKVFDVTIPGDWDDGGVIRLASTGPFPMTVISLTPTDGVAMH